MADALSRYEQGQPIFFYTWTPNWTVGMLKPAEDVVWLEVYEPSLPEEQKDMEEQTTIPDVKGSESNPCQMGWQANDMPVVATDDNLEGKHAAHKIFEVMSIHQEDLCAKPPFRK